MIRLSFGPAFAKAAHDSWIKAKIKQVPGAVSDISYDGNRWTYTILLP